MSPTEDRLPERMRDLRVEAELRDSPDLHRLAQVFIGMALDRAKNTSRSASSPAASSSSPEADCEGEVESET